MLSQIICYDKRFSCLAFHEHILEVNVGWSNSNFLQLLSAKFCCTVFEFSLSNWLRLELTLNQPVGLLFLLRSDLIIIDHWLVLIDWAFDIKWFNLRISFESWLFQRIAHSKIKVFFDFLQSLWWSFTSFPDLLLYSLINSTINSFMLNIVIESLTIVFLL